MSMRIGCRRIKPTQPDNVSVCKVGRKAARQKLRRYFGQGGCSSSRPSPQPCSVPRPSAPCTACAGKLRSPNHTTAQERACPSPQHKVTISVSALLKLAQWCQRRLDDQSGGVVCACPTTLPPACASPCHPSHEPSGGAAAGPLGLAASRESATSEPDPGAGHRPAQPASPAGGAR